MAIILLVLLALFGFSFAGTSSSSSGMGSSSSGTVTVPSVHQTSVTRKICARPGGRAVSGQVTSGRRCRPYRPVQP